MKLVFAFMLTIYLAKEAYSQKCTAALLRKTDTCVKKILYIGDDDIKFIKTEEQLQEHCKELKDSHDCFKKYGKCLQLFPKQIFTLFLRSSKSIIKDRCTTERGRKEFLKHTQCLRKPEIFELNKCVHKGVIALNEIAANATQNQIIPQMCCALHDLMHCLKVKGDEFCLDHTGKDTGNYMSKIGKQFTQDIVDLSCGNRRNIQECTKEDPKFMKHLEELGTPFSSIKPQRTSVVAPMVSVTKKLDS